MSPRRTAWGWPRPQPVSVPTCIVKAGDRVQMVDGGEPFCGKPGVVVSVQPRYDDGFLYDLENGRELQNGWLISVKLDDADEPRLFGHCWVKDSVAAESPVPVAPRWIPTSDAPGSP